MSSDDFQRSGNAWVELEDQAVISFRGSATREFLGRQLTCDIDELTVNAPLFGAWLTAKGRIITLMRLIEVDTQHVLAVLPASSCEVLLQRMPMFVMRDDVKIGLEADYKVFGAWGSSVATFNEQINVADNRHCITLSIEPPLAMFIAVSDFDATALGQPDTSNELRVQHWQALNIEHGLPQVLEPTRESFIPQMLNLDRINAVSFSKGCYPGQEIVARTQHLGRIKRRMFVAHTEASNVQPGDIIVSHDGKHIGGRVVNVALGEKHTSLLALLPLGSDSIAQAVRLHDASGATLEVHTPPYTLSDDHEAPA